MMRQLTRREFVLLLCPVWDALCAGRVLAPVIYFALSPLCWLSRPQEARSLPSDMYVMF